MAATILAIVLLLTGIVCLSSARLGLLHPDQYQRYRMHSPRHMRLWGAILLVIGIIACGSAGTLFAL